MKKFVLLVLFIPLLMGAACTRVVDNKNDAANKEDIVKNIIDQKIQMNQELNSEKTRLKEEVENKFCLTVDDCIIISGGNTSCPSKKAFNKEAVKAHNMYIEESKNSYCTFEIEKQMKSELVCDNYQCDIKYIKS